MHSKSACHVLLVLLVLLLVLLLLLRGSAASRYLARHTPRLPDFTCLLVR